MGLYEDESFLRRVDSIAEKNRDTLMVSDLAKTQSDLVERLLKMSVTDPERFAWNGGCIEDKRLYLTARVNIHGIADVLIMLMHDLDHESYFKPKTGINTSTMLDVSLYTDQTTWDAYREDSKFNWEERYGFTIDEVKERVADVLTPEEVDYATYSDLGSSDGFGTCYFLEDGKSSKIINIPDKYAGESEDLLIYDYKIEGAVSLAAPTTPRDLVIIKETLSAITNILDAPNPPGHY